MNRKRTSVVRSQFLPRPASYTRRNGLAESFRRTCARTRRVFVFRSSYSPRTKRANAPGVSCALMAYKSRFARPRTGISNYKTSAFRRAHSYVQLSKPYGVHVHSNTNHGPSKTLDWPRVRRCDLCASRDLSGSRKPSSFVVTTRAALNHLARRSARTSPCTRHYTSRVRTNLADARTRLEMCFDKIIITITTTTVMVLIVCIYKIANFFYFVQTR